MKIPVLALASATGLLLCSCDSVAVDRPAGSADNSALNAAGQAIPPAEPSRVVDPAEEVLGSTNQEPPMPKPDPTTFPSPPLTPEAPPRRVIRRAPIQPPAEVDPVLPDPGDKVPL